MSAGAEPGPRDRLLEAAGRLLYSEGVNVGVDALLKAAGVARRSLYEHFGGKAGLIVEVLRRSAAEDEADYRRTMDAAGDDPRDRLLAIFGRLGEVVAEPGFRGCRYLAVDLGLADREHPAHAVTRDYRRRVHDLLEHELRALGHPRPARAADQFQLLIDGTLAAGATASAPAPASAARDLAERILTD
ncbi:TetR family transcriptional regulator [Actinomadura sp. CNU-125]|uniref:TetR/AcrR family transcriptional regulator n=1 Tax=Actinomadura sp. CNU-125 TaxID=1904961 RepID=UPI0009615915|nr:TetR/AcrR family transcriptional regulator [Actinomadura sp. CNU-125]OLT13755.1 TetR family transcriptional regulator [Actinomadura sp. CNU-125]